jgi:hypothetical protein
MANSAVGGRKVRALTNRDPPTEALNHTPVLAVSDRPSTRRAASIRGRAQWAQPATVWRKGRRHRVETSGSPAPPGAPPLGRRRLGAPGRSGAASLLARSRTSPRWRRVPCAALVLAERDVQHPVHRLDGPVTSDQTGDLFCRAGMTGEVIVNRGGDSVRTARSRSTDTTAAPRPARR